MNKRFRVNEMKDYFGSKPFTSKDLYDFYLKNEIALKEGTFRWRVYNLKQLNIISSIKRGVYVIEEKKDFSPPINKKVKRLYKQIKNEFPYIKISIWDTRWLSNYMVHHPLTNNIIIEVDKDATSSVFAFLQDSKNNVFINPNKNEIETYLMVGNMNLIVKNLVVESPIELKEGIYVPKIEKIVVDLFADKELFIMYQGDELANIYETFFRSFSINQSTLNRYATKRKIKKRLVDFIIEQTAIDKEQIYI